MYSGAYNLIILIQEQRLLSGKITALWRPVKTSYYEVFPNTGILEPLTP